MSKIDASAPIFNLALILLSTLVLIIILYVSLVRVWRSVAEAEINSKELQVKKTSLNDDLYTITVDDYKDLEL